MLKGHIWSKNRREEVEEEEEEEEERSTKSTLNNQENGNRNIYINHYFKCKWIKCCNQKTQTG